ncbi:hypothetical protein [Dyadobacter psychrotolerans]|uniref:Glycosyl hydrolase family 32 N-terminal domain-containing protein n=1 Tax=Dyadobacter psychrotolerans TaxID=2541721 RepID=A0A4R5E0B1_9BACT|nr:hypothetical protein [Dyadobacter psychrotolerans]TDE18280.1 hypothetical protein E0F88_01700 [Dyadobacter psychrotolerans]
MLCRLSARLFLFFVLIITGFKTSAQKVTYSDGRPSALLRVNCQDEGIVMRYNGGPDSCDTYGAREAVVNKDGDKYYLFYDGAGKDGWISCLAKSSDLRNWEKKGAILTLGEPGKNDSKSASSPWVIKEKDIWHMFYIGTPNTTPPPYRIPAFPYLTMKARSNSLGGPWIKQYDVTPLPPKENSYYTVTSSPGFIVKNGKQYLQFFSGAMQDSTGTKRTLGLARTHDLNQSWEIEPTPLFPLTEQIENSSVFFDKQTKTWYLFTNHIGINERKEEYTDAIWVYWSKDINKWNSENKAIVLDKTNCSWSKGAIGMPSVIQVGNKLALLYDAAEGNSIGHMSRNIGLAWMDLPLKILK